MLSSRQRLPQESVVAPALELEEGYEARIAEDRIAPVEDSHRKQERGQAQDGFEREVWHLQRNWWECTDRCCKKRLLGASARRQCRSRCINCS